MSGSVPGLVGEDVAVHEVEEGEGGHHTRGLGGQTRAPLRLSGHWTPHFSLVGEGTYSRVFKGCRKKFFL